MRKIGWILAFVVVASIMSLPCGADAQPNINRVAPKFVEPGGVIRIIGSGFGGVASDSVVKIGDRPIYADSLRIIDWTNTRIRMRIPSYNKKSCRWYIHGDEAHGDNSFRKRSVQVVLNFETVSEDSSNVKRIKVLKPPIAYFSSQCPAPPPICDRVDGGGYTVADFQDFYDAIILENTNFPEDDHNCDGVVDVHDLSRFDDICTGCP
jgi:hypothetical protein